MQVILFDFAEPFLIRDYHGMAMLVLKASLMSHVKIEESGSSGRNG